MPKALADAVNKAKPAGAKGHYINRVAISSTTGPGVKVDLQSVLGARLAARRKTGKAGPDAGPFARRAGRDSPLESSKFRAYIAGSNPVSSAGNGGFSNRTRRFPLG